MSDRPYTLVRAPNAKDRLMPNRSCSIHRYLPHVRIEVSAEWDCSHGSHYRSTINRSTRVLASEAKRTTYAPTGRSWIGTV